MKSLNFRFKFIKTAFVWIFFLGVVAASCSKKGDSTPVVIDKTALQDTVNTAQSLNDNTVEGTKPGQYVVGTKAALTSALSAAKVVLANTAATQADVTNATANLHAAIAAYKANINQEIAATALVGYWKMNGNANDSSGNGNNGVLTMGAAYFGAGTPSLTTDRFGRAGMAYHFDNGANIDVPYKASLNPQSMSISAWVKWSAAGRTINADTYTMVAMNRWHGYKFQLQSSHLPFYTVSVITPAGDTTIYDRATDDGFSLTENTWVHLVVTFTSGTESFYINGDLVKTWDNTSAVDKQVPGNALTLANPIDFVIGQDLPTNKYTTSLTTDPNGDFYVNYGGFWTGDLDDVLFYNVALTAPQVKSIFVNQNTL